MNVKLNDLMRTTRRIIGELDEMSTKIEEALALRDTTLKSAYHTRSVLSKDDGKIVYLRKRVKDASLLLKDGARD